MNRLDFNYICADHCIDPSIAIEDDGVRDILKSKMSSIPKQIALSTYLKDNF
jgi:hypothetical protein